MLFFPSKFIKIELLSAAVSFLHYTYTYTIWMRTQYNPIEKYGRIELQPSRRGFLLRNQQKLGLKWTTVLILFSLSVGFCLISFSIKFSVHGGVGSLHAFDLSNIWEWFCLHSCWCCIARLNYKFCVNNFQNNTDKYILLQKLDGINEITLRIG